MAETRPGGGHEDKEDSLIEKTPTNDTSTSTASDCSNTSLATSSAAYTPITTEIEDSAKDDGLHYDTTDSQINPLALPSFVSLPSYATTEHKIELFTATSPHDFTDSHQSITPSLLDQRSQRLKPSTTRNRPDIENDDVPLGIQGLTANMVAVTSTPPNFHYASAVHIKLRDMSNARVWNSASATGTEDGASVAYANRSPILYSDTIHAHAGSDADCSSEPTPPRWVAERVLERHQLDAWVHQTSDKIMTLTEKLEKNKNTWRMCQL